MTIKYGATDLEVCEAIRQVADYPQIPPRGETLDHLAEVLTNQD